MSPNRKTSDAIATAMNVLEEMIQDESAEDRLRVLDRGVEMLVAMQSVEDKDQLKRELSRFTRFVDDCLPWTNKLLSSVQKLEKAVQA